MAAAVNPDAFSSLAGSPQTQLNIGKSIFYNERINTTGSGLVQVLLVDGSTFTVGPGSDLVIDKFVYDPKKGTGQIVASFSKGVMRFVGGKISKNDGGVTVNTPAGALAIRGGIAFADFKSATNYSVLFVFGEYVKMGGKTLYMPGYGWFMNNGQFTTREFNGTDLAGILAALTNSNPGAFANKTDTELKARLKLLNTHEPEPADQRRERDPDPGRGRRAACRSGRAASPPTCPRVMPPGSSSDQRWLDSTDWNLDELSPARSRS